MHKNRNSANNRFKSNLKIQITSTMEFNPKTKKQIRQVKKKGKRGRFIRSVLEKLHFTSKIQVINNNKK